MLAHGVHAEPAEVVDRRAEPDDLGDGRSARFELPRDVVGGEPVEAHVSDHLAAAQERWHGVEDLAAAPKHADARRAAHLVATERQEVGAELVHIGREVGNVLAGVDAHGGTGGVRGVGDAAHRGQACRARWTSR